MSGSVVDSHINLAPLSALLPPTHHHELHLHIARPTPTSTKQTASTSPTPPVAKRQAHADLCQDGIPNKLGEYIDHDLHPRIYGH